LRASQKGETKSIGTRQRKNFPLLNRVRITLRSPELAASFAKFGFEVMIKPQDDLMRLIASEAQRWPSIVKAAGLRPD
jgi:tripartite-type tricarboxylate transporter receptor subunit TctC